MGRQQDADTRRKVSLALIALIAAVLALPVLFHIALVGDQRAGCERSKLDRAANAAGWRTAEAARRASYARDGNLSDHRAAQTYAQIAVDLEARSRIDCAERFSYVPFT